MSNKKSSASQMMDEDLIPETETSAAFLNFLSDELKRIYWAEKHLFKAMQKMQKVASTSGLKEAFAVQLVNTSLHVERLEQVFNLLGESPRTKKCEAIAGLAEEANDIIEQTEKGTLLRDTAIIFAVQKMEHYEIAAYGGLVQLARTLGNEDIIALLEETLAEETESDELLNALAEMVVINSAAKVPAEKEEGNAEEVAVYESVNLTRKKI